MAGHESARTTGLYDHRSDTVALDEAEKVVCIEESFSPAQKGAPLVPVQLAAMYCEKIGPNLTARVYTPNH